MLAGSWRWQGQVHAFPRLVSFKPFMQFSFKGSIQKKKERKTQMRLLPRQEDQTTLSRMATNGENGKEGWPEALCHFGKADGLASNLYFADS